MTVSPELFWYKSNYEVENREDKGYGIRCGVSKRLGKTLTANLNAEYERNEYTDPDETADLYTVRGSLDYAYHRFLISLGYIYRKNDSDLYYSDYSNNVVTLSGTMQF